MEPQTQWSPPSNANHIYAKEDGKWTNSKVLNGFVTFETHEYLHPQNLHTLAHVLTQAM